MISAGYAVDNLAVVTNAGFEEGIAYDDLDLAFSRLHCILCQAMHKEFGISAFPGDVGIYFAFSQMECEVVRLLKRFIGEYNDGDMRREEIGDGSAWYVHKIPWSWNVPKEEGIEIASPAATGGEGTPVPPADTGAEAGVPIPQDGATWE